MGLALEEEQALKSVQVGFTFLLLALLGACTSPPPEQLFKQGQRLASESKHAEAVIQIKSALQARPQWPEARLELSRSLLALGQREAAEAELGRLISEVAVADQALPLYLESLLVGGDAKRIVTQHANHRPARPEAMAEYQALLAAAWLALGQQDKAQASLKEALRVKPDDVRARVMQARAQASSGQVDLAAASVQELLRTQGASKEVWTLQGDLLQVRARSDLPGAKDAYAKALQLERAHVPAHAALVQLAMRSGDAAAARTQTAAMQDVAPGHPLTILTAAQLAFAENRLDKAREHTQALLSVFPDLPPALHLAGMHELRKGSANQATRHFRKALNIDPSLTVTREALAEAELRLGQPARALETLESLLAAEPVGVRALALAADARLQQGDPAAAEALYLKASRAQPDD
ncbi:MAG: tetratricopeptide repeat protein, partial [Rubrivivax sp.]